MINVREVKSEKLKTKSEKLKITKLLIT